MPESSDDRCLACSHTTHADVAADCDSDAPVDWIACSHCRTWFHAVCVRIADVEAYDRWYCARCLADPAHAFSHQMRADRRQSARARPETNYAAIQEGKPPDPLGRWARLLGHYEGHPDAVRRVPAHVWTKEWLDTGDGAFAAPVIVPAGDERDGTPSIRGMKVPPRTMTVREIARLVGNDTDVEVVDVKTQMSSRAWTLADWADYFETPAAQRDKVLNVISLEVTGTPMAPLVVAPAMVRESDWVERDWPASRKPAAADASRWPKVQRYVLMGVQGAFTDFHIDFAASNVYYHVVWGRKVFLFAAPTPKNLAAYRAWTSSSRQEAEWLGDALHGVARVEIRAGETMFIPAGWIHAVHTPCDTLVVGGNFLTDHCAGMHWRLEAMEEATRVPRKFRFPHLMDYIDGAPGHPPLLCQRLACETQLIYAGASSTERAAKAQRAARDAVPWDAVPDPRTLVSELQAIVGDRDDSVHVGRKRRRCKGEAKHVSGAE
ncbi:[histone H3]-dimethyl-L-lysine(36) demethylase [Malassezia sp. CBS 17886]|nr:[histone H3]-dimethyl-L-lysine(36) demethylase [Malassezia sp. CBS 17886]